MNTAMDELHTGLCEYIFNWIVVHPDGKVTACCPMRVSLGNLMDQSLEEIWNSELYCRFREQGRDCGLPVQCEASPGCPYLNGQERKPMELREQALPTALHLFLPNTFCNIGGMKPSMATACYMCNRASTMFEPDPDLTLQLVEKLRSLVSRLRTIHIQGNAEAFWKDRIFHILTSLGAEDFCDTITVGTVSNGTLLDKSTRARWFEWPKSGITWSIDAATCETYKRLRRRDYEVVRQNALAFGNERNTELQRFSMAFTINDINIHEVEAMVELGAEAGVDNLIFNATIPYQGTQIIGHTVDKYNASQFAQAQEKITKRAEMLGVTAVFIRPLALELMDGEKN